jgi:hypothetical protein
LVLRHYLLGEVPSDKTGLARLLAAGQIGSIVDYYELLLSVSRAIAVHLPQQTALSALMALKRFNGVSDSALGYVRYALAASDSTNSGDLEFRLSPAEEESQTLSRIVFERFLGGDDGSIDMIRAEYAKYPDAPEWLEIAARALRSSEPNSESTIAQEAARRLRQLLSREPDGKDAAGQLAKLAINLGSAPWSAAVNAYVIAAEGADPNPDATLELAFHGAALPITIPWLHRFFPQPALCTYRKATATYISSLPNMLVVEALSDSSADYATTAALAPIEANLADALFAWRRGDYHAVKRYAHAASASADPIHRTRALQLETWALLSLRDFKGAVETVTGAILINSQLAEICPIRELADAIPHSERRALASEVSLSVFYDLAARRLGIAYDVQRKDAFEDFLDSRSVRRPSQLPSDLGDDNASRTIYFFRYVSVPAVLETSLGGYRSDEDLIGERLEICSRLTRLDPRNSAVYEDEIKSLIRELTIGKGVREIDQNRVYVDVDSVRVAALNRLSEPFARLIAFLRHGIGIVAESLEPEKQRVAGARNEQEQNGLESLGIPENEPGSLLRAMIREVADLFFVSPSFGLERYLSTRIRHGILEGRLRTPLSDAYLITPGVKSTNSYEPNTYWSSKLGVGGTQHGVALTARLTKFSRAYDELTLRISSEWIRARRGTSGSPALFQYEVTPAVVGLLAKTLTPASTLESFVDSVLIVMRHTLEEFLPKAREALGIRAKQDATNLLVSLERDVYKICHAAGVNAQPFETAVSRARTATQREFENVASWFQSLPSTLLEPFTLENAVDVAARSVQTIFRGFDVKLESSGDSEPWSGPAANLFPTVVDLLFPALQNAAQYGRGGPASASASVSLVHDHNVIHITIRNDLQSDSDRGELTSRLHRLRAQQLDGSYLHIVSGEGGTGLHKLRSHLAELTEYPNLSFDVDDDSFVVMFDLRPPSSDL